MSCKDKNANIHYTLDGNIPNDSSAVYKKPFYISESATIKAQAFQKGFNPSMPALVIYDFIDKEKNGVQWTIYNGRFIKMPDFKELKPAATGIDYQFDVNDLKIPKYYFARQFKTYIKIKDAGNYKFYTSSNDGSKLYIDHKLVVDNDGLHGPVQQSGEIDLKEGMHQIQIDYFQSGGSKVLMVFYSSDKISYQPIPGSVLFRDK